MHYEEDEEKKTKHTHTIQIERYSIVVAYMYYSRVLVLYSCLRFEKYTKLFLQKASVLRFV